MFICLLIYPLAVHWNLMLWSWLIGRILSSLVKCSQLMKMLSFGKDYNGKTTFLKLNFLKWFGKALILLTFLFQNKLNWRRTKNPLSSLVWLRGFLAFFLSKVFRMLTSTTETLFPKKGFYSSQAQDFL